MKKNIRANNVLLTIFILAFNTLNVQITYANNVFAKDQETYGNWSPSKFVNAGWSGYHIVAKITKEKNLVKYDCGDNCTRYHGPYCPDGDCKYIKNAVFFRQGTLLTG